MADSSKKEKELGGRKMSTGTKIVVGIFAVVMALSMMLPSLAPIFAGSMQKNSSSEQAGQEQKDGQSDSEATKTEENKDENAKMPATELAERVPDNENIKTSTNTYAKKAEKYEKRLATDPKNLAALLNAGQTYMNWGYGISYSATADAEKSYVNDVLKKAIEYFDSYLALNDAKSVKVDRALCKSSMGDTDAAIKDLEAMSAEDPTFPLVWANLGMLYQTKSDSEKATEAYQKAVETDPNDEYGAKSYANQQIISLNSKVSSPGDAGDASISSDSGSSSSSGAAGLSSTLANNSGTAF